MIRETYAYVTTLPAPADDEDACPACGGSGKLHYLDIEEYATVTTACYSCAGSGVSRVVSERG